jgi:toxin ParE1/3/4
MRRLRFHPAALDELDAAVDYHEAERAGYGALLFAEATERVGQAARLPRSGVRVEGFDAALDVRLFALRRFRYVVITARVRDERFVVAVAHTSREPSYWRERLR